MARIEKVVLGSVLAVYNSGAQFDRNEWKKESVEEKPAIEFFKVLMVDESKNTDSMRSFAFYL